LWRVDGIAAKRGGGMSGPAWVVEKSARHRDAIRMAVGNDRLRLVRVNDHADCLHHNPAGLFDAAASDTW
jgi:hypothetical protein